MPDGNGSIIVCGTMSCDPAHVHDFKVQVEEVVIATRLELGCLAYHFVLESEEQARFVTIERWSDDAALHAHMGSPHIAAFIRACGPHIRASDIAVFDALGPRVLVASAD